MKHKKEITVNEGMKFGIMFMYAIFVLISSFFFNSPISIMEGMKKIIVAPSILVSDYMAIGNIGAALFNSGLMLLISINIVKLTKVQMNGSTIAALFTVAGFSLFGKNIYNVWSVVLGVYLYARIQKEKFSRFILIALFGMTLGPLVSQISFGLQFPITYGIVIGNIAGLVAGFILPPLAHHFTKFHQGFNLYNIGFTAGIIGTLFMSLLRAYGKNNEAVLIITEGHNFSLGVYLNIIFFSMIAFGYYFNGKSLKGYRKLLSYSGRAVTDFVILEGFGLALINMGILGLTMTVYVFLVKGQLNGPTIGGIMTVVAFGAFGKHIKNILPILAGVILGGITQIWELNETGSLLAALFGTTLAPISGQFGWKSGILAGFLHLSIVMNVGYLHGGMNLYNNGFSGGIVAAILVPIIDSIKKEEKNEAGINAINQDR